MKLRNKKTGEIGVLEAATYHGGRPDNIVEVYEVGMGAVRVLAQYHTLEELNEEWEDYKSAEPRIKDKEIRKAIRAWAEANGDAPESKLKFDENNLRLSTESSCIEFDRFQPFLGILKDGAIYTIDELCGEEEE